MIRPATSGDASAIAGIYNHYVRNTVVTFEEEPVSDREMRTRLSRADDRYPWLVNAVDGAVVGYAYAAPWSVRPAYRYTVETSVYVAHGHPRKGYGTALYTDLIGRLRKNGLHSAIGVLALPNPASVALHERLGFRRIGEICEAGFKQARWVDVGYWQLLL